MSGLFFDTNSLKLNMNSFHPIRLTGLSATKDVNHVRLNSYMSSKKNVNLYTIRLINK